MIDVLPCNEKQMFTNQYGFAALVDHFQELAHHAVARFFVIAFVFDAYADVDGIADEYRLDESQAVVSVGKCFRIDHPCCHADGNTENESAMGNPLLEVLSLAPFHVHVVRIKITRLAGVHDDIGLCDRASASLARCPNLVVFKVLGFKHAIEMSCGRG